MRARRGRCRGSPHCRPAWPRSRRRRRPSWCRCPGRPRPRWARTKGSRSPQFAMPGVVVLVSSAEAASTHSMPARQVILRRPGRAGSICSVAGLTAPNDRSSTAMSRLFEPAPGSHRVDGGDQLARRRRRRRCSATLSSTSWASAHPYSSWVWPRTAPLALLAVVAGDVPDHARAVAEASTTGGAGPRLEGEGRRRRHLAGVRERGTAPRRSPPRHARPRRPSSRPSTATGAGHAGDVALIDPGLRRRREPQGRRPELLVGLRRRARRHPRDRARGRRAAARRRPLERAGCRAITPPPPAATARSRASAAPGAGPRAGHVPAPGGGRSSAVTGRPGRAAAGGAAVPSTASVMARTRPWRFGVAGMHSPRSGSTFSYQFDCESH